MSVTYLSAQDKVEKKVAKLLGDGYEHFDPGYLPNTRDSIVATPISSRTVEGVIIGYEWEGEFIASPDTTDRIALLYPMLIGSEFVSRGDFLEFRDWVRDSIARMQLYYSLEENSGHWGYADYSFSEEDLEYVEFVPDSTALERQLPVLDWSKKLKYDDPSTMIALTGQYLPQFERFRELRVWDNRKTWYDFDWKGQDAWLPIIVDSYNFALNSSSPFDQRAILAYLDDQLFHAAAVTNIEPFMAEAYCIWKSEQLSKQMAKKGKRVICRLPTLEEAKYIRELDHGVGITMQEYDHTNHWKITNNQMREFSAAVLDSLRREYLYNELESHELAAELLDYTDVYLDEAGMEFREFDPADRFRNRDLFPFSEKKVKWHKSPYKEVLAQSGLDEKTKLYAVYEWIDAPARAQKGTLVAADHGPYLSERHYLETSEVDSFGEPIGEDLILDIGEVELEGFGTRDHQYFARFTLEEHVAIPAESQLPKNDEIADITYDQALAYYNWKYRMDKFEGDENDDWQQFIFPSEHEFNTIKSGTHIVYRARRIPYEYPTFRMVVEIVPANQ